MKRTIISGIQQLGIGVKNVREAWGWYKTFFGIDVRVLEESARAEFMLPYTGGKPRNRHAALAITLQGGGGFEIWNHTDFEPRSADFEINLGDLGIFAGKIKCKDPEQAFQWFTDKNQNVLGKIYEFEERKIFYLKDPYGNIFQLVKGNTWFRNENKPTGGAQGAFIGCTDVEKSKEFYAAILGYDTVVYDKTGTFEDFSVLPGGNGEFRRVLLRHSQERKGPFSRIFGDSEIELVQALDRKPRKIFENRFWGELGFIHLCYDIQGMDNLRETCKQNKCAFTVDTGEIFKNGSFDMGDAAGLFAYTEDPDGALIEFVETHKLPILKKLGVSVNLQKRDPEKSLPNWLLNAMRFLKAKDIGLTF